VEENYVYRDFNGVDWYAIHTEYASMIKSGISTDDFYTAMESMIHRLGDNHSRFFRPSELDPDDVSIGVLQKVVPVRQNTLILAVEPGGPADEAGLKPRDSILLIKGEPVLDESDQFKQYLLEGPEGTSITVTVQSPGQAPRSVNVILRKVVLHYKLPYQTLTTSNGLRVGYVMLYDFDYVQISDLFESALKTMNQDSPLDGLIVDCRVNSGGQASEMREVLSFFTDGLSGYYVKGDTKEPIVISKGSTNLMWGKQVPLVVLIGPLTISAGEVFAGILKDKGRAYLIGERTQGHLEILSRYTETIDGSKLWLAESVYQPINYQEEHWNETGVVPDLTVVAPWDLYEIDNDPAVEAALEYFDSLK
jgi:C-terminal peptidase prc